VPLSAAPEAKALPPLQIPVAFPFSITACPLKIYVPPPGNITGFLNEPPPQAAKWQNTAQNFAINYDALK
jgi:hypothetical protein